MRLIKKYGNRKLYDATASRYVTLRDLADMVVTDDLFEVVDFKTGTDITAEILGSVFAKYVNQPIDTVRQTVKLTLEGSGYVAGVEGTVAQGRNGDAVVGLSGVSANG